MKEQIKSLYFKKYNNQKNHICLPGVKSWLNDFLVILFPLMGQKHFDSLEELELTVEKNKAFLINILECQNPNKKNILKDVSTSLYESLFELEEVLNKDVEFFVKNDPACLSSDEVIGSYPGFYAIACYRIANKIINLGFPLVARMITEVAHEKTGVDIHPKAEIGSPFFIDHATGIVIGETSIIGNEVSIYQGVTLGALKVEKKLEGVKRHPTVEDGCVIYANATILGGKTTIGKSSIIGGNVWLSKSVPPFSSVFNEAKISIRTDYEKQVLSI